MITLLFWPLMIASIICSFVGFVSNRFHLLFIAAIMIIPMSLYLAATPKLFGWGLLFPFFYLGSAFVLKKGKRILAILMSLPVYAIIGWIGYVVLIY